jgi:hypothetical protein
MKDKATEQAGFGPRLQLHGVWLAPAMASVIGVALGLAISVVTLHALHARAGEAVTLSLPAPMLDACRGARHAGKRPDYRNTTEACRRGGW